MFLIARSLGKIGENFSGWRGSIESKCFFLAAVAYFLYKLAYFILDYLGAPPEAFVIRMLPNTLLLIAAILMMKASSGLVKYGSGKNG